MCGSPDNVRIQGTDTIGNPVVIVEVLSESTCDSDRGQKFELYQSIPALRDYLLIEQTHIEIEHRYRANSAWTSRIVTDGAVRLTGVDLDLSLALVYKRVTF